MRFISGRGEPPRAGPTGAGVPAPAGPVTTAPDDTAPSPAGAGTATSARTTLDPVAFAARLRSARGPDADADADADERAWQAMLAAWGLPHTPADARAASACAAVLAQRTYCTHGTARLERLLAAGRPVLLQLRAQDGAVWALLLAGDGSRVRLQLDQRLVDVDRATLLGAWDGRYAAVWRTPADLVPAPLRGSRGHAVDWLRERLVREGAATPAPQGAPFDEALADAVRRFQRDRGLDVDGVAGPETLFTLSAGDAGPRLARSLD